MTFDNEDFSSCSASPASCLVSPLEKTAVTSAMANSRPIISVNKDSVHLPSKLLGREPGSNETDSKLNVVSTLSETAIEPPQRFSFDGFELENSRDRTCAHNPERETGGYDSSGLCSSELNGFLSDSSGHKEHFAVESSGIEKNAMLGGSEHDDEAKARSPSSLDRFSVVAQTTSDFNLQKNISCNVGTAVAAVNSAVSRKSLKGLSLPHSDSVTSNTSMASTCSQSSNL